VVGPKFDVIGEIRDVETIAVRASIRDQQHLNRLYGRGRWRKLKGKAVVRILDGMIGRAEIHYDHTNPQRSICNLHH
jgi:hypothetical protein